MPTDKVITKLVNDFVARLREVITQATREEVGEAIRKFVNAGGGGRGRGRTAQGSASGPLDSLGRRRKRTEAQIEAQTVKVLDYVKANPGERMETMSRDIGQPSTLLAPLVKRLIAEKRLKAKGKARGTTYFPA